MEITLEKIELVTDRTGASYKEAKEALEASEGNVVDAIIYLEEKMDEKKSFFFKGKKKADAEDAEEKEAIMEKIKALVAKGNVSRIVFKKDDEVFLNIPVNAGAVGVLLAPWVALVGTGIAIYAKFTIEIIKEDGDVIDIIEVANDKFDEVSKKTDEVYKDVKSKVEDTFTKKSDEEEDESDEEDDEEIVVEVEEEEEEKKEE